MFVIYFGLMVKTSFRSTVFGPTVQLVSDNHLNIEKVTVDSRNFKVGWQQQVNKFKHKKL